MIEPREPRMKCSAEHYCDPLAYCIGNAPTNQPWAPYVDALRIGEAIVRAVFVSFPGKAPGLGGKRVIYRHCPFCGTIIDPTIEDKPRRWYNPRTWRRKAK